MILNLHRQGCSIASIARGCAISEREVRVILRAYGKAV